MATTAPGIRERKKQRTRELLAETAWRLFAERGFERVTVADVAEATDVSVATVFNYFATKEAMVFDGMRAYEARLVDAVRDREPGEPALAAVARFLADGADYAAQDDVGETIAVTAGMVAASPTLRARQEEILAEYTQALAAILAAEAGVRAFEPDVQAAAHALFGVHRAVLDGTRRAALAGERGDRLAGSMRAVVTAAARVVAAGLHDYAPRRTGHPADRVKHPAHDLDTDGGPP